MKGRHIDVSATSFVEVATAKVGLRQAIYLSYFVQDWADVREKLGRDITMAEYVRESGRARSSAYRQLSAFRRVFDRRPDATPNDVLQLLEDAIGTSESRVSHFRIVPA